MVQGFNRTWLFDKNSKGEYGYQFSISPDYYGYLYDWSLADKDGRVKASLKFWCKLTERPKSVEQLLEEKKYDNFYKDFGKAHTVP